MTEIKRNRHFLWLVACVFSLFVVFFLAVTNDGINNPVIEGRSVEDWLEEMEVAEYSRQREIEQLLIDNHEQSLPGLISYLERKPHPFHVEAVKMWNRVTAKRIIVPNYSGVRAVSARTIGEMGTNAGPAVVALMNAAVDPEWRISEAARIALLDLPGSASPTMANHLGKSAHLKNELKWVAIIKSMGADSSVAIPELIEAYERTSPELRSKIIGVFEDRAFHVWEITDLLIGASSEKELMVRSAALRALGTYENVDEKVRVAVSENLDHPDFSVRFHAACARCMWNDRPVEVLPLIRGALESDEHRVRAVTVLGRLRSIAKPAIPDLIRALINERNPRPLRMPPSAGIALSRIGDSSLPALLRTLQHDDPFARLNVVVTLGVFGERANSAAESLLPLLHDESEQVRHATALTLSSIGFHTREAIPVLLIIAEDDDPFIATWAGDALAEIDPALGLQGRAR